MRYALAILCCSLLIGCASIETEPDDTGAFVASGYARYAWRHDAIVRGGSYRDDQRRDLDGALRDAVDERLAELGYRRVERDRAQFLVEYLAAPGLVDGHLAQTASNITARPSGPINRQVNQAEVDNAYALGKPRATGELALVFTDGGDREKLWSVRVSTVIENSNKVDPELVRETVRRGLETLPAAPGGA